MPDSAMPETLPQGDEKAKAVRGMFDAIAPRYDLVNRIMTFRLDVRWRRLAVGSLALRRDSRVLDLACGTGDLCRELGAAGLHADRGRPVVRHAGRGRAPTPRSPRATHCACRSAKPRSTG